MPLICLLSYLVGTPTPALTTLNFIVCLPSYLLYQTVSFLQGRNFSFIFMQLFLRWISGFPRSADRNLDYLTLCPWGLLSKCLWCDWVAKWPLLSHYCTWSSHMLCTSHATQSSDGIMMERARPVLAERASRHRVTACKIVTNEAFFLGSFYLINSGGQGLCFSVFLLWWFLTLQLAAHLLPAFSVGCGALPCTLLSLPVTCVTIVVYLPIGLP